MSQVIDPVSSTSPAVDVRRAERGEEFVYLLFVMWVLVGLCLDGWAHRHRPELETFFTPWHGVFYTGFIGGAAWLAKMIIRRRPYAASLRASIPDGYELSVIGLAAFAVGGVGDGFWHTAFGVEVGIDALLSPTHLLMLVAMLAGVTAPIRSAWRSPSSSNVVGGLWSFLPVMLSIAAATTGVAFFFLYANGFNNWQMGLGYTPGQSDVLASVGILSTVASTVILLGPAMVLLRRWRPPFGSFTVIFAMVGVFMAGLDGYRYWWQILAPLAGGLTADLIVGRGPAGEAPGEPQGHRLRRRAWLLGLVVPLAMWSVSTVVTHLAWTVRWPPELWVGQIVMAMLAGFGLAIITHPPSIPDGVIQTTVQP